MRQFILSFLLLLWGVHIHAQINVTQLDQYLTKVVQDWEIPGMTVGIIENGQLVYSKGFGVKEEGMPDTPDGNTLYAVASNTKAFTSALIAILVDEDLLSWEQKIVEILPHFKLYDPYITQLVTVKDLLCHRVGLGTFSGDAIWYKSDLTILEILERIQYLSPAYEFRDGYGYSNLMYLTAGEVIHTVTGKSWSENVRERILQPLEMDRTLVSVRELPEKDNYATPHRLRDGKNIPIKWADWTSVAAMGGLISSIEDMSKWMIFNLNHGILGPDTLLSKASRNQMWTPHNTFVVDQTSDNKYGRDFSGYGLGWGISDYHGHFRVGHTGGYDGMITAVNLLPDDNAGVIVLTNGMKSPIMAVTYYVFDRLLELPVKDWSGEMLETRIQRMKDDNRITSIKEKRVAGTKPSLGLSSYTGKYHTALYGDILVAQEDNHLRLTFSRSPALSATLMHWHYDTFQIKWDEEHAWFDFGTVQFVLDHNAEVHSLMFDVPNDDIFFEEYNPVRKID